jgi:biopolymer transport protein ExbD
MTPLVDVAFLLLIFFMVTTVFRTPQALEINLPPKDNPPVPIAKSNILTIYALPGDRYKWQVGETPSYEVPWDGMANILKTERDKNPNRIVVVIKIHPEARFHAMVDIIDLLDTLKMTRFALAPMTDEDKKEVGA